MWSSARHVAAGDTVIVWLTRDHIQPLIVTPGRDFNTKFGNFKQDHFVGVPYGSKVPSRSGRGFVHILRPTPELWTVALPHRTQILYLADIAFITAHLAVRPGSRVVEAGTGSASFSHSVARTVGAKGHLYSYEFHEARYIKAREEFARHGLDGTITLAHRNVCKDGFTVVDEVDAVFLDLPAPWDAVEHAKKALRKDTLTRICCFSPCMEQVLRTVSALNEAGFCEITTYETLLRPHEVFQQPLPQSIESVSAKLKASEVRREEKRLRQVAANRAARAGVKREREEEQDQQEGEGEGRSKKVKVEGADVGGEGGDEDLDADADADGDADEDVDVEMSTPCVTPTPTPTPAPGPSSSLSTSTTSTSVTSAAAAAPIASSSSSSSTTTLPTLPTAPTSSSTLPTRTSTSAPRIPTHLLPTYTLASTTTSTGGPTPTLIPKINVAKALPEVRGHTSYLTFACLAPVRVNVGVRSGLGGEKEGEGGDKKGESKTEDKDKTSESENRTQTENKTESKEGLDAVTVADPSREAQPHLAV